MAIVMKDPSLEEEDRVTARIPSRQKAAHLYGRIIMAALVASQVEGHLRLYIGPIVPGVQSDNLFYNHASVVNS